MKNGKCLNPYCPRYCLLRSKPDPASERNENCWMAFSTNSRMAAIGKICLKTCLPTQPSIGTTRVEGCRSHRCPDAAVTWASTRTSEKKAKWTTLLLIDSQAVKNTCNANIESKGFCFYKCTNGIKRHLAWIHWVFRFSPTVLKLMSPMTRAGSKC